MFFISNVFINTLVSILFLGCAIGFFSITTSCIIYFIICLFSFYIYRKKNNLSRNKYKYLFLSTLYFFSGQIIAFFYRKLNFEQENILYLSYLLILLSQLISIYFFIKFIFCQQGSTNKT